jgi:hypothetical protein
MLNSVGSVYDGVNNMMLTLEFDPDKGYGNRWLSGRNPDLTQYMAFPIVRWCHKHIGPINWPKAKGEAINGQGWQIHTEWQQDHPDAQFTTRVYVRSDLDSRLITEFWMRFGA